MKILEEMFDLNTIINELKQAVDRDYNFESKRNELETNIHIFSAVDIPLDFQQRYAKFNNDVRRLANDMIEELVIKRDDLTIRLLQQQIDLNRDSEPCQMVNDEKEENDNEEI